MTRIPVSEITSEEIVSVICSEIDQEHYVILYLDSNCLYGNNGISLHELLIYGYDREEENFYCPFLVGSNFKEGKITFDTVKASYKNARECYMHDGWRLLVKRSYFFGITSIRVRLDYRNDNFVADILDKIDHDIHGRRIVQTDFSEEIFNNRVCYTGNACFRGLSDYIQNALKKGAISETVMQRLIRTLKMMYDYRILFLSSIDWFVEAVNGQSDSALMTVKEQYTSCANEIQRCYLMLCKCVKTKEFQLLYNTVTLLNILQKKEIEILSKYRKSIFTYYYRLNGVPMPPDD